MILDKMVSVTGSCVKCGKYWVVTGYPLCRKCLERKLRRRDFK